MSAPSTPATSCCARCAASGSSSCRWRSRSCIYFLIAAPNRDVTDFGGTGISAPLYYMVGLAAFGTMAAILSSGARIAGERAVGWNRQLRLTPLRTRDYFRTKVITAYLMAGRHHRAAVPVGIAARRASVGGRVAAT